MFMTVVTTMLYSCCKYDELGKLVPTPSKPFQPIHRHRIACQQSDSAYQCAELCRAEIRVLGLALQDMCCGWRDSVSVWLRALHCTCWHCTMYNVLCTLHISPKVLFSNWPLFAKLTWLDCSESTALQQKCIEISWSCRSVLHQLTSLQCTSELGRYLNTEKGGATFCP